METLDDFVNVGEQTWNEIRSDWRAKCVPPTKVRRDNPIDPDVIYLDIVGKKTHLTKPVPLQAFLTVLMEVWDKDGFD